MIRFLAALALLLYLLERFRDSALVGIAEWFLYGFSAVGLLMCLAHWRLARRLFGRDLVRLQKRITRLRGDSFNTGGSAALVNGVLGLAVTLLSFTRGTNWSAAGALLLSLACHLGLRRVVPPVLLLLGASSGPARGLYASLARAVLPLTAIHLLEVERDQFPSRARVDAVRTRASAWRDSVAELVRIVGIVVVDMREPSPAVDEELRIVVQAEQQHKIVLVAHEDERLQAAKDAATAAGLTSSLYGAGPVLGAEQCIAAVRRIVRSSKGLPTPTHRVGRLLMEADERS